MMTIKCGRSTASEMINFIFMFLAGLHCIRSQLTSSTTVLPSYTTSSPPIYTPSPAPTPASFPAPVQTTYKLIVEEPVRVQLIFSNNYDEVKPYLSNDVKNSLSSEVARYFGVIKSRIQNLEITSNVDGKVLISFTLNSGGHEYATNRLALSYFRNITTSAIILRINNDLTLFPLINNCDWADSACPKDSTCRETNCSGNNALYALFVIPIVILIIAVILLLLWYFKYREPSEKTRIDLTELGYVENRSKFGETISKSTISGKTGLSLADSGVRNEVYSTMGRSYGFSYENADFTGAKESDDLP